VEEWISERRNAEARRLLVETHEGVENIGTLVGYDNPTYSARRSRGAPTGRALAAWRRTNRSV